MTKYRRYDDEFQASAVLMLEAAGYPADKYAIGRVAGRLKMPQSTLRKWFNNSRIQPHTKVREKKRRDIVADLKYLLGLHIDAAERVVEDSGDLRAIDTGIGILVDKIQLLSGGATWRGEIIDLLQQGALPPEIVTDELGDELATELFDAAGLPRPAG